LPVQRRTECLDEETVEETKEEIDEYTGEGFPMNLKQRWIGLVIGLVLALVMTVPSGICSEIAPSLSLDQAFDSLEKSIKEGKEGSSAPRWRELEQFQTSLWKAMALDPTPGAAVPVSEVPKELFAAELNQDLKIQWENLEKSPIPKQAGSEAEFKQYASTVTQILNLREARQFPLARAIAKRGILDHDYKPLLTRIQSPKEASAIYPAWARVEEQFKSVKDRVLPKDPQKRELFTNGNQFIWYTVVAFFGFFVGVIGIRFRPDFFQKFADTIETAAPSNAGGKSESPTLDYSKWLKELEEILSRLRSSQIGHERRIEDMVQQADQMVQQAGGLAADARIKNEPNLEFRVNGLLKHLRGQMEHAQKLKAGDRVQITVMMEHCLKLCDAIEAGAIHYDRSRPESPPTMRSA
jgi:hypothetical protein